MKTNVFPLDQAAETYRDAAGRMFFEPEYEETGWESVTLPHTFNDGELFSTPIRDAGSGQTRCCAFYRNELRIPPGQRGKLVFMTFEGIRQTCYLYVNGHPAGYYEAGVGPFGFELTSYLNADGENTVAVATDNTSTRDIPFCIAETPNLPGVKPGYFLQPQEERVPPEREGVGFQWNCNDFNPVLGGITQPVRVVFKNDVFLTLPLYANLKTRGVYVYGTDYDIPGGSFRLHVEAEARNTRETPCRVWVRARLLTTEGKQLLSFSSKETVLPSMREQAEKLSRVQSIVPEDAYIRDERTGRVLPAAEDSVRPTEYASSAAETVCLSARAEGIRFWSPSGPQMYIVRVELYEGRTLLDTESIETGFRKVGYDNAKGVLINDRPYWLRGYAQRSSNEWAASGIAPEWMHDLDAILVRESNANHIRFMHVAASPMDIRACDRHGIAVTQPAGDKERETFGRQWDQRVELMRNVIIAYRNHPSILFWEAGNNVISPAHMREMTALKRALDPNGGRFMGCRTLNTEEETGESEYVGTMLNRHAARYFALSQPIMETEYAREEAAGRLWDDFTPPDFDFRNKWIGKGGVKRQGLDFYDLTGEELALANAAGYSEFFNDRIGGASGRDLYSGCAALCWTDSAQHGRQSFSENGRMSGRVNPLRVRKHSFDVFRVMQSTLPDIKLLGHWNYPPDDGKNYYYHEKRFNGSYWEETDTPAKRDPRRKTVYCAASYPVARVRLSVNGVPLPGEGVPVHTFLFAFRDVDLLQPGMIEAVGMDEQGRELCRDRLETAMAPASLKMTVHTSPAGPAADGNDLMIVDLEVLDAAGRLCPLCDGKIDLHLTGPAMLLGGYNSGRFDGNGRTDSVIHKNFVYAECGRNRVLLRAAQTAGTVTLTARMAGLEPASVSVCSRIADTRALSEAEAPVIRETPEAPLDERQAAVTPDARIDREKYTPDATEYCKILLNGQEPDFKGVRAVNRNGRVWGNVLCVLERMKANFPDSMDFIWDRDARRITVFSDGHTVIAEAGGTHLKIDGEESLMDGAPYVTPEGIPVMEVSAMVSRIRGVSVQYDDRIRALRIRME